MRFFLIFVDGTARPRSQNLVNKLRISKGILWFRVPKISKYGQQMPKFRPKTNPCPRLQTLVNKLLIFKKHLWCCVPSTTTSGQTSYFPNVFYGFACPRCQHLVKQLLILKTRLWLCVSKRSK